MTTFPTASRARLRRASQTASATLLAQALGHQAADPAQRPPVSGSRRGVRRRWRRQRRRFLRAECLAASVSYAISYIYMDRYLARRGMSPVTLSACQLLAAAVMLAIALAVSGASTPHFTAVGMAGVVILGILGTGVAYVLNYQIITSEGATVASTVTYLLPVVAIVLGVVVLGETVTLMVLAGIALVLAGEALTRRRAKAAIPD